MKHTLSILLLASMPTLALAAGDHGGHDHGAAGDQQKPGMADMSHASHDAHNSTTGKPGDPAKVNRVIEVSMDDSMRFTPAAIQVKTGETIRFLITNSGKLTHEMVLGSMAELKEHAEMMRSMPDMQHAEANMISLKAGQRGGIVWQFEKAGMVDFACLVPGHMEAGMVGTVKVE